MYRKPSLQGTICSGKTYFHGTFSCGVFCLLACKCPLTSGHLLCGDTINVMLLHLLINGFSMKNRHGVPMKNRRK